MKTPSEIIDAIGVPQIASRLDVAEKRVKRARYDKILPAAWYFAMCDMVGAELPPDAFTFKGLKP